MSTLAILLMEDWNDGGSGKHPGLVRQRSSRVNPVPENMYNTAAVIDADNVDFFFAVEI